MATENWSTKIDGFDTYKVFAKISLSFILSGMGIELY